MPTSNFTYSNRGFLTLMVGPSGAGKTTYIRKCANSPSLHTPDGKPNFLTIYNSASGKLYSPRVISPDDIREELTGDRSNQNQNKTVFELAHLRVAEGLASGNHVIFDATNLSEYSRSTLANLADFKNFQYIILDRKNKTPWHGNMGVVRRHEQQFAEELPRILNGDGFGSCIVHDLRHQFDD